MAGLRDVRATRYVEALREGGSMPGLVEADDDGMYVVKWRGAAQGPNALVAEVVAGELARRLGLAVPELVVLELAPEIGKGEPDPEIQEQLVASVGPNLGMDYLPGALPYAVPPEGVADPGFAADVVWLDALVTNVDRTHRNPNLLRWHGRTWLIDHGAALFRLHGTLPLAETARMPVPGLADHVLLADAGPLADADARLAGPALAAVDDVVARVPDVWLGDDPDDRRTDIADFLRTRLAAPRGFVGEIEAARAREPTVERPFAYAILRVVPQVERGERLNVGVVLFCRQLDFLGLCAEVDEARLAALAPALDVAAVRARLAALGAIAAGEPGAGPIAALSQSERFGWIVAPASTVIQHSPVHSGLTADPPATLERLFRRLVL